MEMNSDWTWSQVCIRNDVKTTIAYKLKLEDPNNGPLTHVCIPDKRQNFLKHTSKALINIGMHKDRSQLGPMLMTIYTKELDSDT